MYIFKEVNESTATPDAVPIKVFISNRADLVALLLRILRYLFQQGIAGSELLWKDDPETTGITIEDSFLENPEELDMCPAITVSCGGITFNKESIDRNKMTYNLDNYDVYSRHLIPINLDIRGRNKLETYKMSEVVAAALFLLTPQITESCPNIIDIQSISASPIVPLSNLEQAGDDGKQFNANVSFVVEYFVGFKMYKLGDLFSAAVFTGNVGSKLPESDPTEFTYIRKVLTEEDAISET